MTNVNDTHDPKRRSWVESANDPKTDFPIQNLPFGTFRPANSSDDDTPHLGIRIGESILDLSQALEDGLLSFDGGPPADFAMGHLNLLMKSGAEIWSHLRQVASSLLWRENSSLRDRKNVRDRIVIPVSDVQMTVPSMIGDYTDFYASIHHATNVGSMFRPDNPLLPNYKHLPVGYHGRASSIVISGTSIRRPMGQTSATDVGPPTFGPSKLLDYEMEMGFFVGPGNDFGTRITMQRASDHIFGMVIVNDWSARDVQKWEYQPLGPFNAKNFATSISPWVVTMEALEPFRTGGMGRDKSDPEVLEYLRSNEDGAYDITVEVHIASQQMREKNIAPMMISRGNFKDMYWTIAQMLVHHTSTGCNMIPGDLLASGTISGPTEDSRGCLLERTWRGQNPIKLPDGTERKFLQDGDEVIMRAYCERDGFARIGFGECRGVILPAQ